MGWDDSLETLMPDTVTVYAAGRPAADGSDTFSTASATYPARVTFDPASIQRAAGPVTDVSAVAWVASTVSFAVGAKVLLPDGTAPPVKQVVRVDDMDGLHHVKVLLGKL